jgi:transposase
VRWILDGITWKRPDPWLTPLSTATAPARDRCWGWRPAVPPLCTGLADEQSEACRKRIEIVVIDPSAPYASGIRATLPDAKLAVDIWHLVALANHMVTEAGSAATRDQLGRRGTSRDLIG